MRLLRLIHIITGVILAPFILITALTGAVILIFNRFWELLSLHSWFRYGGIVVGVGLFILALTGFSIFTRVFLQQKRRKKS